MTAEIELYKDTLGHPDVLNTAHKLATQISSTDFVPKAFRGKPEAVMAALLTGRELGLGPMTALQRIHVIEGKAGLDAQGMRAQVLAAGHELWIVESTPERCTVAGRRRGSEHIQQISWTIQDARNAGLANRNGPWKTYPRQMLQARATAELCRLIAPDALGGLAYSSEELADETPQTIKRPSRQTPTDAPADVVRITTAAPAPETPQSTPAPAWDDDDVTEAEIVEDTPARRGVTHNWDRPTDTSETSDPDTATTKQINKLSILFNRQGWDEDTIDAYLTNLTAGRTTSRKDLTKQEASNAIEELEAAS